MPITKRTWRVWIWENGVRGSFFLAMLAAPSIIIVNNLLGLIPALVLMTACVVLISIFTRIPFHYPTLSDLPEWQDILPESETESSHTTQNPRDPNRKR